MYYVDGRGNRHPFRNGAPIHEHHFRQAVWRDMQYSIETAMTVPRDNLYGEPRRDFMSENAIIPATKDINLTLRPSEHKLLIWALDYARRRAEGSQHAHVISTFLNKLTDLTGSTEERFDKAVDALVD